MDVLQIPALVLDYSKRPLYLTCVKNALLDILSNKAISILDHDIIIRSPRMSFKAPNIIVRYYGFACFRVKFSKLNVIYRDNCKCVYCDKMHSMNNLNVDHIVPISKWNEFLKNVVEQKKFMEYTGLNLIPNEKNSWLNCVCACKRCNVKKGNKYPWDTSYRLHNKVYIPKHVPRIVMSKEKALKRGWYPYLEKFNGDVVKFFGN